MLVIFLLACFGLLWLAHRFSLLLSLPIETSVKTLSIPIPKVPLISVDKVADTSMVIHWNDVSTPINYSSTSQSDHTSSKSDRKDGNNLKDSKDNNNINPNITNTNNPDYDSNIISHYLLYINGIESVLINGKQHKCTLDGLQPGTNYQIDLVAFNIAGFRSRSSPIFIKTSAKPIKDSNMQSLENPDNVIRCLLHEEERASVVKSDPFKVTISTGRSRSGTIEGHQNTHINNNSNNANTHHNDSSNSKTKHPHLIDDINELKWLLESGLEEVQSLMKSYREAELEFEEEELNLISSRNEARERRKYEDNNRTNLRQEIKLLEEQRVKSASRISADEKKIKERLKKIENFNSQIEKWEKEIEHMKKNKEFLLKENPENLKKLKQDIVTLNKQIFSSQTEVHEAEEDLRDEIAKRKTLESQKLKVVQLFEEIDKNINDVTGLLSKEGMESLNKLIELKPEWKDELRKEIVEIDEKAESDWKALQQKEWLNFNNMKTQIDEQNKLSLMNNNNNNSSNTNNSNNLTTSISIENNPTTSTNTTNVNGYLYNSLPSSSNNSINGFNNQNYNNNSMRNLIRPRITTAGSFHGSDLLNDKSISQPDSATNTFNSSNNANIWPINLSIDSNTANMINQSNNGSIDSPTVNMLLPQNLIDDEDFDHLFETQTRNQPTSSGSVHLMSPALSAVGIKPSGSHQQNSSISNINNSVNSNNNTNNNSVSPNLTQLTSFDAYPNNSINGLVLNSTPQNNRVTSLGALTSANNQNNILTNSAPLNIIGSPQSLHAYLSNDNSLSTNLLDLSHAATTSPFGSNGPLNMNNTNSNNSNNINNSGTNTTSDIDHSNVLFNQNSVLLGSNLKDSNNHYSKIFGSLNGGNNSVTGNESGINNDNNGNSISRARSTSFGSSIWSNGNNGNTSTWGSNNKANNGFSFLGAPITMTSTTPNNSQNGIVYSNSNTIMNKLESNNDNNNFLFKNSTSISTSSNDKDVETVIPENESPSHPSSPSFLKSMIEKLGASPTKTISNKTYEHAIDENDDTVDEQISKYSHSNSGSNTHHKSTSLGSSRFFKLSRKNSVVSSSQHSGATGSSSSNNGNTTYLFNDEISNNNGMNHNNINVNDNININANVNSNSNNTNTSGFMSRKLSFAFKRDKDKEKD